MIIDAVKEYIQKECPYVSGKKIKVNNLGEKPVSMSIEQVPGSPVIKKYVDGGSQRQMIFVLAAREEYTEPDWKQIEVAQFYEKLQNWFEEQNAKKTFPDIGDGLKPLRFEVSSSAYLMSSDYTTARYQIQCKLIYYKERR